MAFEDRGAAGRGLGLDDGVGVTYVAGTFVGGGAEVGGGWEIFPDGLPSEMDFAVCCCGVVAGL